MGKTPKEIRDDSPGVAARGNVTHSSTSESNNESIGVLAEDVSRVQSAINDYSASLTYKIGDEVKESGQLFRCITAIGTPEVFDPAKWEQFSALQGAYDFGEEIQTVDATPVKITAPTDVFQSVLEVIDQDDDVPLKIEGSGEIEQQPFNLMLASTVNGSATSIVNSVKLVVHSRFLFVDNGAALPDNGIEIFSIANPENPELLTNLATFFTSAGDFQHHGDILYVIDVDSGVATLRLIDIGIPTDAKELGSFTSGTGTTSFSGGGLTIQGSLAFIPNVVGGINKLTILDVSDPANIIEVNTISNGDGGGIVLNRPSLIVVHENFLFVYNSGDDSVECIDISDPKNPSHLSNIVDGGGSAPFLDSVVRFHVTRDVAHFCNVNSKSIQTIDYADPTAPVVKDSIKDGDAGVSLGDVVDCVIAGRYVYILNKEVVAPPFDILIATIDLQDADNLVFLQNKAVATETTGFPGGFAITGDHLYATLGASQPNGKLYSFRNSGLETQSMRVGAGRFGDLDVKDMTTCRLADVSESLHVGGRGILSNGKIAGQKSSDIVRKVRSFTLPSGAPTPDPFNIDLSDDVNVYDINADAIDENWDFDVINPRPGHRALLHITMTSDSIFFTGLKYFTPIGLPTSAVTTDAYVKIEALLDDGSADSILLEILLEN